MTHPIFRFCTIAIILLSAGLRINGQSSLPEVFEQGTITEQFKYLDERTRIYDNFRAIREDMFRIMSRNAIDTLANAKARINALILQTNNLDNRIDSLNSSLESSVDRLKEITRTKDSISILGLEVNKITYNTVTWSIIAVLVFLLVAGFLAFQQNRVITLRTKKDLDELKEEFEEYRKKTRLEREKMSMDHFNELRKLRGG